MSVQRVGVVFGALAALILVGLVPAAEHGEAVGPLLPSMTLSQIHSGLVSPIFVTHAGDGSDRLFIVEQRGTVREVEGGVLDPTFYLDVRARVTCCGERGLLGLAFAPDFASSGRLYISYTGAGGQSVLERITVADPAHGRPGTASGTILLTQAQPASNHNGGHIAFGPDGYLYLGLGDGGSANDPWNNAQNLGNLLGAMLRLDVSGPGGYTIPADNPFVGDPSARDEIWAYGLRNPWRFSFDRDTGDLWIGDVGQNAVEEINWRPASSSGGENYGWRVYEGTRVNFQGETKPTDRLTMTWPVLEYQHNQGCSVTGGYVYRGADAPADFDMYLYADFCSGRIWRGVGLSGLDLGVYTSDLLQDSPYLVSSFGEDEDGELYLVDYSGRVFAIGWT